MESSLSPIDTSTEVERYSKGFQRRCFLFIRMIIALSPNCTLYAHSSRVKYHRLGLPPSLLQPKPVSSAVVNNLLSLASSD